MSSQIPFPVMTGPVGGGTSYGPPVAQQIVYRFINRTGGAISVGDVLGIDVLNSDSTSGSVDNTSDGIFSNLISPSAGLISGADAGAAVVITDLLGGVGANDTDVLGCIYGPVTASADATIADRDILTLAGTDDVSPAAATDRVFAIALAARTGAGDVDIFLHNGMGPFAGNAID